MRRPQRKRNLRQRKGQLSAQEIEHFYMEVTKHRCQPKPKQLFLPKPRVTHYELEGWI